MQDSAPATLALAKELGLSEREYAYVCEHLDRVPNYAELGVFSAMFSEHCSYKSSKRFLKKFPTKGKRVLQGPGENAGILDIGHGWAVAFKMESHNHPSFIEPYQGAATGVGGILRDVFTMGARPIASMDGLCFGAKEDSKTPSIVRGVVKGVGDYGNSVGVPTVAGQTCFHPCYNGNPLVNAFTVGLVRHDDIFRGYASGIGNLVVYVGAKTGRDGVHGASMASQEFNTEVEPERPTVQVGDPFTEKLLLEAALEIMRKELVVGIQDMGAAGITSSSFEMAHRAGTGLEIDLDAIPVREANLSAFELLLSESQERMLLVCKPEAFESISAVFEKWDLHAVVVGKVVEGTRVKMQYQGAQVVNLPVNLVVDPLSADWKVEEPKALSDLHFIDEKSLETADLKEKIESVLSDFNFAHAQPITEQYDSMVGVRTKGPTDTDAAVLRLHDVKEAKVDLALTMDCNPRLCLLWPREGGRRAVAESALNLAVKGATPMGITDCLNFGSPENPEVLWQFSEAIDGISQACQALETPVVSGNVSFYNETDGHPIYPTPMIGMVGLRDGELPLPHAGFFDEGLEVFLLGDADAELGGSAFASQWFKKECGKPQETDLNQVKHTVQCLVQLNQENFPYAAHDISDGGLIQAVFQMAFQGSDNVGVEIRCPSTSVDRFLFGEKAPRVLLALAPEYRARLETLADHFGLSLAIVGKTTHSGNVALLQSDQTRYTQDIASKKKQWQQRWEGLFN